VNAWSRRGLFGAGLGAAFVGTDAMAVEEPAFRTIARDGDFDIRDYPALVVAEVSVSGDQQEAASRGFRLLASYIFGANKRRQGIAMTAPVAQAPSSETIAMTAPVAQSRSGGEWTVRFTMPSAYSLQTLPAPNDPRVRLRVTAPARFAVLKFSGLAGADAVAAKTAALEGFVRSRRLRIVGPVWLAQYDPPWTLWFMRRNEVMVPVAH
jgi:hypothetical protein